MLTKLDILFSSCAFEIDQCKDLKKLDEIRTTVLGKNGRLTQMMKSLKDMSPEEKKIVGAKINDVKNSILAKLSGKIEELELRELERKLANEYLDITMPVDAGSVGFIHPITKVMAEISEILRGYGFVFVEGPDIESEYHNFDSVNMPEHHPARNMQDTFYINALADEHGRKLLRTQTTAVENAVMRSTKPPFRVFTYGRTYRSDYDATHTPMFNQVELLLVDKDVGFAQLKWLIKDILKKFFELDNLKIRFRPSFFPFTEPSAEADMNYEIIDGKIKFGVGNNWLEVGGCGVTHPNVLREGGIDPNQYRAIAFGLGIERLASLKYGVADLRCYFESNKNWRETFGFSPTDL